MGDRDDHEEPEGKSVNFYIAADQKNEVVLSPLLGKDTKTNFPVRGDSKTNIPPLEKNESRAGFLSLEESRPHDGLSPLLKEGTGSPLEMGDSKRKVTHQNTEHEVALEIERQMSELDFNSLDTALHGGIKHFWEKILVLRRKLPPHTITPQVEIRCKNLTYKVNVPVGNKKDSSTISTVWTSFQKAFCFCRTERVKELTILNKISGVFRPGTMTLLLGPPGSGKSTLLKALAGRLPPPLIDGSVTYNEFKAHELLLENIVGFVGQNDLHIPLLTVRETLKFAVEVASPSITSDDNYRKTREMRTDYFLRALGLERVANTIVGNELIRGVSGGQRKRVTTGEMIVVPRSAFLLDEISTGLDSATTFDIIRTFLWSCKIFKQPVIISLLQPSPEVFALFDEVLVLSKGQVAYHGPRDKAVDYFYGLGFQPPYQKDRADFLQEVTTPVGKTFYRPEIKDPPRNPDEFSTRWKHSELFAEIKKEIKEEYHKKEIPKGWGTLDPHEKKNRLHREYAQDWWTQQKLVLARQWELTKRDKAYAKIRAYQMIIMGIIIGTVYYQMPTSNFILRYGVIFFCALYLSVGNLSTVAVIMRQRAIFYKQNAARFFRPSTWAIAHAICHIPFALVEALLLSVLIYWLSGLDVQAHRYVFFLFILFLLNICLGSYFRWIACVFPNLDIAQPLASFSIVIMMTFAGFLITYNKINRPWVFAYWLSPLSWGVRSLCQNEFEAPQFDFPSPYFQMTNNTNSTLSNATLSNATQTAAAVGAPRAGDFFLSAFGFFTDPVWKWAGVGYLFGFYFFFLFFQIIALNYLKWIPSGFVPRVEEEDDPFDPKLDKKIDIASSSHGLPFTPMSVVFRNISYFVDLPGEKAHLDLLSNVSGFAKPGRMIALMGESGAGKTTLLDVLAGRKTGGHISGDILINGFAITPKKFRRIVGYVEQMDIHSASATVREALQFSANLRLPREVPVEARSKFVEEILELLELTPIANALIGTPGNGLSTEQRKRVTIGVELVANPSVLFLDEPTSGLDSRAAQIVVRVLRRIAQTNRTIICTIHQPSLEIFTLFDDLLLLKRGGKVAYFGALGEGSDKLISYLEGFPETKKIEAGANPAGWMLDVLGSDADFIQRYNKSEMKIGNDEEMKKLSIAAPDAKEITFKTRFNSSFWRQSFELSKKFVRLYWRSPSYNFVRMLLQALLGLLFGTVFYKIGYGDISGVHSRIAVIYFSNTICGIVNMVNVLPVMAEERAAYYRERASKTYSVLPYSLAIMYCELPYLFVSSGIFVAVYYFMVGFSKSAADYFFYWLIFFTWITMKTFFGQFCAVFFPNVQIAQVVGSTLVSIWNTFCGFLIPRPNIPAFWIWLYWLSPARYALDALCSTQFHCIGDNCPKVVLEGNQTTDLWQYIQDTYGFRYEDRWIDFVVLILFCILWRVGAYLALKYVNHLKR